MSRICPNCSTVNTDTAMLCSKCRTPLNAATNFIAGQEGVNQKKMIDKTSKILVGVIIAVIVVIIALLCVFLFGTQETENGVKTGTAGNVSPYSQPMESRNMKGTFEEIEGQNDIQPKSFEDFVHVASLELSQDSMELEKEETAQLSVYVYPDNASVQTVSWYSTDESVVQVDEDGYIVAVEEGTAEIYAVSYSDESVRAKCTVVVKNKNELIEPDSIADYGTYYVLSKLSLRYGPSVDYEEIELIKDGEAVRVFAFYTDDNSNVWAYVDYGRYSGWVFSKFLSDEDPNQEEKTEFEDEQPEEDY